MQHYGNDNFKKLRDLLGKMGVDSYLLPLSSRNNTDLSQVERRRFVWLSQFTGDSGLFLMTHDRLIFFANNIYYLQAQQELCYFDSIISLHATKPLQWICENRHKHNIKNIGYDPELWSISYFGTYSNELHKCDISLKPLERNPIDEIMEHSHTYAPCNTITCLPLEYSGSHYKNKVDTVAGLINHECYIFSAADSIAWLLNLRGHDNENTPLFFAELLFFKSNLDKAGKTIKGVLFSDNSTISQNLQNTDLMTLIAVEPISKMSEYLHYIRQNNLTLSCDPRFTSIKLCHLIKGMLIDLGSEEDPCQKLKAIKNTTEIEGFFSAHLQDATAVIRFIKWLEENYIKANLTEMDCANKIDSLRKELPLFQFNSFPTIAGFGANGAIIHYHPQAGKSAAITKNNVLLLDSGGHYLNGTTDVTRTIAVGTPSSKHKLMYTLVLKGHLALQGLRFPRGTTGKNIDCIARQFLWQHKLDYGHGTGHGVGHYSMVHESPPSTSSEVALEPNMVITIEPGVYIEGEFGIRIENVTLVTDIGDDFLGFQPITMIPYDKRLIDFSLLSKHEINTIRNYHLSIVEKMGGLLDRETIRWLENFSYIDQ